MISRCCNALALKAVSAGGWYINGMLTHEWYECVGCKQTCDTLDLLLTQPKDATHEQGRKGYERVEKCD